MGHSSLAPAMSFLDDLSEELAAQGRAMLAELPAGEIGDDDPVEFAVVANRLLARTGDGAVYSHLDGAAVRYRRLGGGFEVTAWRDGGRIGTAIVPAAAIDPGIAAALN